MRLPRMTTRRWMIAVAVVALVMGEAVIGYRLIRLRAHFLWLAMIYDERETYYLMQQQRMTIALNKDEWLATPSETSRMAPRIQRMVQYNAALRRKYDQAARYPWLPVEPDPPEP